MAALAQEAPSTNSQALAAARSFGAASSDKNQTPNFKYFRSRFFANGDVNPTRPQILETRTRIEVWLLKFFWSLDVGAWSFVYGAWCFKRDAWNCAFDAM